MFPILIDHQNEYQRNNNESNGANNSNNSNGTAPATPNIKSPTAGGIRHYHQQRFSPTSPLHNSVQNSPVISPRKTKRDSIFEYKSEAVRKIEEIAKNRDERRQKQAEERAYKDQFALNDHLNPHFEFSQMITDARNKIHFQPLRDDDDVIENQITVCVRKRPLNSKEILKNEIDVITVHTKNQLIVHEPKTKFNLTKYLENQNFRFDYVFDEYCNNEIIYKFTAKPLVKTVFEGGMATCFAYGQTGAGKTHTMGGEFKGKQQNIRNGIYGLVAQDIFNNLSRQPKFTISASFFEIYGKFAFDLLEKRKRLRVLEDGKQVVQVVGLTERPIGKIEDILNVIKEGSVIRTSGQTSANSNSSRSHAVLQIILRNINTREIHGKFSLIDLAGNERGADTSSSSRQTQMEGADINRSLLALKECIRALGKKDRHCPFRESILTKILRDSFIGDKSRTCMIALISPNIGSVEHSLNTLRYADRVKELVVNPKDSDDDDIIEEEFDDAEDEPIMSPIGVGVGTDDDDDDDEIDISNIEWEVLECTSNVIDTCENFQKMAKQLMDCCRKDGYDKFEFARNWKNLLREMIEVEREAYVKVSEFCDALQE